ncbi:MAG: DUF86 domain-containing protein [Candidatus Cloacimonetes bacterium]|nr:DUF86 domain-containing protein [Candidatus Cloacimonadota bacterium]
MCINENDLALLLDIYECCQNIIKVTKGVTFRKYDNSIMIKSTIERQLEIIGQAAKKISKETQERLHFIPWKQMIGMRNILSHDYGKVLSDKVWLTSQQSIPELLKSLINIEELKHFL